MPSTENWIASKLRGLDFVERAEHQGDGLVVVVRKDAPDALVSVLNLRRVQEGDVAARADACADIDFFLNVPKEGVGEGNAIELVGILGRSFGGLGDAFRALRDADVRDYINPETGFVERILAQHSRIASVRRIDNKVYELGRHGLRPVTAYITLEYEVTAETVRRALELHGPFDVYVSSDPNARPIAQATHDALASTEVDLRLWPAFMSDLHRDWA